MALSNAIQFEVRQAGSDNNGGGFKEGATGTDRTLQTAAHATLSTASLVNATTTIIDVDAGDYTCTDADVGNVLQITGGSATAGFYEITARSAQQWTLDRSAGTVGQTVVGAMGGALALLSKAMAAMTVAGMRVWVKNDGVDFTYATAATSQVASYDTRQMVIGYGTTRGDGGRPTLKATAAVNGITATHDGWVIENLIINGDSTGTIGILTSGSFVAEIYNVKAMNCTSEGLQINTNKAIIRACEVTGCAGANGSIYSQYAHVIDCWSHDNTQTGIYAANVERCRSTNNTGASSDGIFLIYQGGLHRFARHNVCHGNGRDGIRIDSYTVVGDVSNNIFTNNTGTGLNLTSTFSPTRDTIFHHHNAYRGNGTAKSANLNSGVGDVTLTADPYTNAASDDYTLNGTAGGGAACKDVSDIANLDIGAYRHADPAGGGGTVILTRPRRVM